MFENNFPEHSSSVAPGHKLIALLIAAAVAVGFHTWFNRNGNRSASSAELSLDTAAARRIDPGLAAASEPAAAIAQSMLTDPIVAELSKSAYLSSSEMTTRIGEFRSRLDLTQPSAGLLRIQFHDADPAKSAATANAIAKALAAASRAAAPASPASLQSAPSVAPAARPATTHASQSDDSLATALKNIAARLSSTDRELDHFGSRNQRGVRHPWESSSYSQSKQQQLLKARVREAQRQVDTLRAHADDANKDRLGEIQRELTAVLPAGHGTKGHPGGYGFNGAGTSASEIRRERAQLARSVGIIESERQAIAREEGTEPASASDSDSKAASGSASSQLSESDLTSSSNTASRPEPSPQAPQPQSGSVGSPPSAVALQSPFQLAALAGTARPSPQLPAWWPAKFSPTTWWIACAAGLLAGLIYFGFAARASRTPDYDESDDGAGDRRASLSSYRLITPDRTAPDRPSRDQPSPDTLPSATKLRQTANREAEAEPEPIWNDFFEPAPSRRASFSFDSPSTNVAPAPAADDLSSDRTRPDQTASDAGGASLERRGGIADPWADTVKKTIAQTEIGRMLGDSERGDAASSSERKDDSPRRSSRPDRLAG